MGIFKANDIRGLWPREVNGPVFERLGRSLGTMAGGGAQFVVGCDGRLSGPELKKALIDGLLGEGARVIDLGQVSTPECYFAKRAWNVANLAMVTASHNPLEYNGLKVMLGDRPATEEMIGPLEKIYESFDAGSPARAGECAVKSPRAEYIAWLDEFARKALKDRGGQKGFRIVFDAGHGPVGAFGAEVFERSGVEAVKLNCSVDGRFPGRDPNCAIEGNLKGVMEAVRSSAAALAVSFDGDGDRLACIDNLGRFIPPDELAVLLVRTGAVDVRGRKVVYDIKCSSIVPKAVRSMGGEALVERSGHAYIRQRMLSENARFGVEVSGHYFYRELAGGDDAMVSALRVAAMALGEPLAELRRRLVAEHHITPDVRVKVPAERQEEIIESLSRFHGGREQLRLDGLRVELPEGWGLVRKSITEPKLTFRFEAESAVALEKVVKNFTAPLDEELKREILEKAFRE